MDKNYEGMYHSEYCPREREDCTSYHQIIAENHQSFICCGENDGKNRTVDQDKYRPCIKSSETIDTIQDCDKRDLIHQAAVITFSLAAIEENDCHQYHKVAGQ